MERNIAPPAEGATPRLRYIVVAYHYPPDPAVGSLRARNVARALAAAGHEVHIVTAALPNVPADSLDGDIHVHRVELAASLRDLLARLKRLVSRGGPAAAAKDAGTGAGWKGPAHVSTPRRWIAALTWLPDDRQGFIRRAAKAAARLMQGDGRDVLYTTAPPFSDHLVGLFVPGRRTFQWIVEYRDPWNDGSKPWFVRSRLTDVLDRWVERRCLASCDGVVTVTKSVADALIDRMGPTVADKVVLIRNGIPRMLPPIAADPMTFLIVYAGSFYMRRDPKPFLAALASVHRRNGVGGRRLDVRLVGDCRFYEGEAIEAEVERLGLTDVVTFVDWLPHAETMKLMQRADLLLLLAQCQPLSVPNKLYEYVGMGKPILAAADEEGETALLLRQIGGHYVVGATDGPDVIERALTEALATSSMPRTPSPALAGLATDAQMALLVQWLDGRLHRPGGVRRST